MSKHSLWGTVKVGAWRLYLQWLLHLPVYCSLGGHAVRYIRWRIKKSCSIGWPTCGHNFRRPTIVDTSPKTEVLRSASDLHGSKECLVKRWFWFSSHWGLTHPKSVFAASKNLSTDMALSWWFLLLEKAKQIKLKGAQSFLCVSW